MQKGLRERTRIKLQNQLNVILRTKTGLKKKCKTLQIEVNNQLHNENLIKQCTWL